MRSSNSATTTHARSSRGSLYQEVTDGIIADIEKGIFPWVQPWGSTSRGLALPINAVTQRRYSGINILVLWRAARDQGFASQHWLTFKQALAIGGSVRKGARGTTIFYASRFVPREPRTADTDEGPAAIAFLKRFTVFNLAQCDLPDSFTPPALPTSRPEDTVVPRAEALIKASGATIRIGGDKAAYAPLLDLIVVPPQASFHAPINFYRTCLHELGHWTGHKSRLNRDQTSIFGSTGYAREELIAEMTAAFTCAALEIVPTVRHADYLGSWLKALREDSRAIFRAASAASKASDFLLAFDHVTAASAPLPGRGV